MLLVPFLASLSLAIALVDAHDIHLNHKRLIKIRSPQGDVPPPVAGAGAIPSLPSSDSLSSSVSQSSLSQSTASSSASSDPSSSSSVSLSESSVSESTSSTVSSSSVPSTTQTPTSEVLNLTDAPPASTSTVVPTITRTQSVDAAQDTGTAAPVSGAAVAKGNTFTVIIAVAASIGGAAILWTIFRKWKLSSSKKFDQRLNPITNWQPDAGDDNGIIPNRRRASSRASSFHSGSGHAHSNSGNREFEHDFTAGPATSSAPIGGYADLARGAGPAPPMQEHLTRGPSFNNRGYDMGVPIHHQGYPAQDTYGARY
ncbi:hypothetical protein M413DRAFT_439538 [Hebeloma cylindrosporum]|uniref:Mid2 domain-containing protein n=1 Tax=Hebeloma cylindrosporum TaxID=76867 RepID=A0A0C2Z3Q4_HEBCY|nr:hypothetical protein M413DRAFT_439538 [Hebeloma cylindrosporum h7]